MAPVSRLAERGTLQPNAAPNSHSRHKHTESALRDVGQLAEEIIQGAAQGIIVYDTELRYQLFNPFMQKLTGKSEAEVLGKIAPEMFPALKTYGFVELLQRALQGEVVHAHDVRVPNHAWDGEDVWESCIFTPHRDIQGNVVGVIGLVHDVTERHQAEETFRVNEFYKKGCQEKSSASTGVELCVSRSSPL